MGVNETRAPVSRDSSATMNARAVFLDPAPFEFVDQLQASWTVIRDECLALRPCDFEPWVQREMYGEGWEVYGLLAFGRRVEGGLAACPRTAELDAPEASSGATARARRSDHGAPRYA